MYPVLIEIGGFVIPSWHAFYALGAIAAYALLVWLARRHAPEIPEAELAQLYASCYIAGYLGARLLSIVIEEPEVQGLSASLAALFRFGPMTFYGGAIAAFGVGLAYAYWKKLPIATLTDITIPAGLTALALGRVGCFLNGDDFGLPLSNQGADHPFYGVIFPNLGDKLLRHPTQLYEAFSVSLLLIVLLGFFRPIRTALKPGAIAYIGIVGYANVRIIVELFRGDFRGSVGVEWLSTSQFISVLVLILCASFLPFFLRSRKVL